MAQSPPFNDEIASLARLLTESRRAVALTGAGISTESGIPDFRSPGGVWTRMTPITYDQFVASEAARLEDWRRRFRMNAEFAAAEPNDGHRVLTWLAGQGRLEAVVTQNIDGLHQRAGFPTDRLVELHGNATHGSCLDCGALMQLEDVRHAIAATDASPCCACGGLVKAAIVSFGQKMPETALARAVSMAGAADLLIVIGSSLQVRPAATLPLLAKRAGARLVIVNRDPTAFDDAADLSVRQPIGKVFSALRQHLAN